jgi:phage host-nuclease inhibitor protein Gam
MNRPRRISSCLLGALGIAVLGISSTSAAQGIDNRPIFYVMLKSLEDGFQAYNERLAVDVQTRVSRLRADYASRHQEIANEVETLEANRKRREWTFKSERDALNMRIDAVDEQIALRDGRISEDKRIEKRHSARYANDPDVVALRERIAAELAEIDTVRTAYLTRLAATRKARTTLTSQFEEYMSAGDPLALEIRSLEQDWQRFAEAERRKLKQLADAYAVDYLAYNDWLEGERAGLEQAGAAVARTVETDREQRALHAKIEKELRGLIDEYNALVEVHGRAGNDDPGRDERAVRFSALEQRIADSQAGLARAREAVLKANEEFDARNREYEEQYQRFSAEKRERDASLAADLAEINAVRLSVEADIDVRRQKVDAQIKTLETHISSELEDARSNLETLNARLIEDFGRDHEGLDVAITQVLDENDDGLLYTAAGAPRFDLSRPLTAVVYTAVERVSADRRRIDARIVALEDHGGGVQQASGTPPQAAGTLEQERATLTTERQQLLEAHATFAREHQARAAQLERRRQVIDTKFSDDRALLGQLYSARANVTQSELQAVQRVLVAAVRGVPGGAGGGSDHARLVSDLREKSRHMSEPVDESLQAPHALLDHIASEVPVGSDSALEWQPFASRKVTGSSKLTGADKTAVASAWLAHFRRQPGFASVAAELDASGAVGNGGEALASLFMAGVMAHTNVTEQRLDDGGIGIQVDILGRAYQLDSDGSLEQLPSG